MSNTKDLCAVCTHEAIHAAYGLPLCERHAMYYARDQLAGLPFYDSREQWIEPYRRIEAKKSLQG